MSYFKIVCLLLPSVILAVRGQCPAQCTCPSSQVANCASLALPDIPAKRFDRSMEILDISDNNIVSLDKTSLRDLEVISLVQLNATRNNISDIDEEAFLGHSKLQTVDLSRNSLKNIEPKTFIRNPSLEVLSLSSNQYLRLPEEGPFLYSQSIRVLHLSDCNLSHFPPETFQKLPNLQKLYISHNKFEVLNSVQSAVRLTLLDVGHNYLTDIQSDIFTALPKLSHLNLSYNRLSTLNMTVVPQLARVSSSDDLNGNSWVCDCQMFNTVYFWCINNSVDWGLVCSSPSKFKGQRWIIYETAGCDDDNTDTVDQVEQVTMIGHNSAVKSHENYINPEAYVLLETEIEDQETENDFILVYVCGTLFVVFLCLAVAVAVLSYRLKLRLSSHKGYAQSNSEP